MNLGWRCDLVQLSMVAIGGAWRSSERELMGKAGADRTDNLEPPRTDDDSWQVVPIVDGEE